MFEKFIAFFNAVGSDDVSFDQTNHCLVVEVRDTTVLSMSSMVELIALCGTDYTFTVDSTIHCEADIRRYDTEYESRLYIEIQRK